MNNESEKNINLADQVEKSEVISEKFREWTEGKESTEARISVFNGIRDIPYAVVHAKDPKDVLDELLIGNKGPCTEKHMLLAKMFNKLNIETRFVSHRFKWSDLSVEYPEDLRRMSFQMPVCDHLFCQAHINGEWVSVDATWDLPLEQVGFPVNKEWDGISNTLTAVTPIEEIIHTSLEERESSKKRLVDGYSDTENLIRPEFYKKFHEWLDAVRSITK